MGPDKVLEKVGEIIHVTVSDKVAIVKGMSSETFSSGSDCALDSDMLLVFDAVGLAQIESRFRLSYEYAMGLILSHFMLCLSKGYQNAGVQACP